MAYKDKHKSISFRLPESELGNLKDRVAKSKMSKEKFLRKCVLGEPIISSDVVKVALKEVRKQGINLNQIARSCNIGNTTAEIPQINQTLKEVENTWQFLKSLIQKNTKQKES